MHNDFRKTSYRTLRAMVVAWAALLLSFWLPSINLDSSFAAWVVRWTNTGDVTSTILIGLALAGLLSFGRTLTWRRRLQELLIHILVLALLQGGGALVNEHLLKPLLAIPRPNIVWLAEQGVLEMPAEHFYSSMDRGERRTHLEEVLTAPGFDAIVLRDEVRDHWIRATGYSFPSGHAFSAMLFATYFLAMVSHFMRNRIRWVFHVLPGWAVLIGWSRVLLRVHCPEDVILGGLQGIALGVIAAALAYRWLRS
jgi:phosphatidylglycerophosphatase B